MRRLRAKAKLRLVARLLRDSRVPLRAKLVIPALALYLAMPFDIIPDFLPVVGHLDDVVVIALAFG